MPFLKARRNLKDPEKIAADLAEKAASMALNINFADIVLAAWQCDEGEVKTWICRTDHDRAQMLEAFWGLWRLAKNKIGFNCLHYDIPLAVRQSQLLWVDYPREISVNKYRPDAIDLYQILTFQGEVEGLSLQTACALFGREGETGEDGTGAEVAQWIAEGDWARVVAHGEEDVRRTAWLAKRLRVI